MKKKIVILVLMLLTIVSMTACNGKLSEKEAEELVVSSMRATINADWSALPNTVSSDIIRELDNYSSWENLTSGVDDEIKQELKNSLIEDGNNSGMVIDGSQSDWFEEYLSNTVANGYREIFREEGMSDTDFISRIKVVGSYKEEGEDACSYKVSIYDKVITVQFVKEDGKWKYRHIAIKEYTASVINELKDAMNEAMNAQNSIIPEGLGENLLDIGGKILQKLLEP